MLISDIQAETVGLDPTCRSTRPFLSGEVLLPVQPCLQSAVRGCGRPVDDPREARSNDRAGRRDLEPPVRLHGSPGLNRRPFPVGIRERIVGREGLEPSMFLV